MPLLPMSQASLMRGPLTITWFALRKLRPTPANDSFVDSFAGRLSEAFAAFDSFGFGGGGALVTIRFNLP